MDISTLENVPCTEWHGIVKEYVESTDRACGVVLYYKLVKWWEESERFLPGTEDEWRILDILEALTGECSHLCYIGTGDYHYLE